MNIRIDILLKVSPADLPYDQFKGFWVNRERMLDQQYPEWGEYLIKAEMDADEWFESGDDIQDCIYEERCSHEDGLARVNEEWE